MAESPFSAGYLEARERFLAAARRAGAVVQEHRHPASGPLGEPLYVSIARLGPADADRGVLTISGTHGVEGFCGSACQLAWLQEGFGGARADGAAVVHVHAINPFGFAAVSRVTEDNIDLNRNFRADWGELPRNTGYLALAPALVPEAWSEGRRAAASRRLEAYAASHGRAAWQAAIMGGQYDDPEGVFYGGRRPCWSNHVFRRIAQEQLAGFAELVAIDLHTGLGPRAAMELMSIDPPGSPGHRRAQAWFDGELTSPYAETSNAQLVQGPLLAALPSMLPEVELTLLAVEFGTSDTPAIIEALRADNWARRHAQPGGESWADVKLAMREHFCPRDADWEAAVIRGARQFAGRVVDGLQGAA